MSAAPESKANDADKSEYMVWIDCEMTGLDTSINHICEIAVLITDKQLNTIAEGPNLVIHHEGKALEDMSAWCKDTFSKSGLLDQIKASKTSIKDAEKAVLKFLQDEQKLPKRKIPLCGNSIHADRSFIAVDMPGLDEFLHYRLIDVSTIKELVKRWYPKQFEARPKKKDTHRAMDDIKESIAELAYYRKVVFSKSE